MDIKIIKKDSNKEDFSYDKLFASIAKAGVPVHECGRISTDINNWILKNLDNGEISSESIKIKVIEILSKDFPVESENYKTFKIS